MEIGLKQLRGAYLPNGSGPHYVELFVAHSFGLGDRHPGVALALSPSGVNDHLKNLRRMKNFFLRLSDTCYTNIEKDLVCMFYLLSTKGEKYQNSTYYQ